MSRHANRYRYTCIKIEIGIHIDIHIGRYMMVYDGMCEEYFTSYCSWDDNTPSG